LKPLKITDLRVAVVTGAPMRCPILRIDTNQEGLYGLGEVRDGASVTYALMLKSRLVGEDPRNVDRLFRKIKQFGFHGRQAGGVCGVEMALWDIVGKAYGVPIWQLLGGKFRDKVRIYADTTMDVDPAVTAQFLQKRQEQGFTFLKMDFMDTVVGDDGARRLRFLYGDANLPIGMTLSEYVQTPHQFTGAELTDDQIARIAAYVGEVRRLVGDQIPLAGDHFGHFGVASAIRLARALEPYNLAWLEDLIPWQFTDQWKRITDSVAIPTCTGEDIYLKEGFVELARRHAVDILHPDLASSGGILETKKIGDAIQEFGIPMAMHFAGGPISFLANVHCAAATENFLALEFHSVDIPWWDDLVTGLPKPLVQNGFATVPDAPGLGVTLDDDRVREHLADGRFFEPTTEWDHERSWDRLWS
jgi:L-alanine-DL-glutamate epimerase-like enolase superfamily enzyme